ncbi:hypothetical protein G3I59_43055 [Amycolatopsis rubida]|uniref:Uncharacterized protein n=1 Tax=Amycolatopsis rubida TaxID=112413 RepID=A0A1I5ECH1_9PSEU|nr:MULTISPECIES: hypothetical protein [Amycolatopsis]MYW97220.1 hypothetical protein [Amycolatopsis rubida]NEC62205.1 hypothetical protein [Amycolatopsis rubida]OAP24653.1 hypothetical protein A4R44_04622 [Amycolatopsis sp. M39]SFO09204.1 hypothetical protein SAMN05421854_101594 [Amycolatopsis rubida]
MADGPVPPASPDPRDQEFVDRLYPRRSSAQRLTLVAWLAAAAVFVTGIVFFVLPVTTVYYLDRGERPIDVRTIYGTRSDQALLLPANMFGEGNPPRTGTSYRIGCGTALNSPDSKLAAESRGAEACSIAERPRMIVGWLGVGAGVLGAAGLVVGRRRQLRANAAQTHFPPSAGS